MSGTIQANKNSDKGVKLKSGGIAGWKSLNPLFKTIFQKLNIQFTMEGLDVSETVGGVHIKGSGVTSVRTFNICQDGVPGTVDIASTEFVPSE